MEQSRSEIHIPNKRYFTIGEVSNICGLKTHVLRYWEQEFSELEPIKRKGNRRYYQQKDLILVLQIKDLLQNQGFTIDGAKTKISSKNTNETRQNNRLILQIKQDLEYLLDSLKK
tara:strand:+ start:1034 stop:1378 length:345 start_codon:yes stop_codon:yes gene_type:complete